MKREIVAITGSSGGLGKEVAYALASKGCDLIFLNRNLKKSEDLKQEILAQFNDINITCLKCDLEDIESVRKLIPVLLKIDFSTLILNAGIYNEKLKVTSTGYNNIFQVNFLSQYYLVRRLLENHSSLKKVVAVSSVAHNYSKININDLDFSYYKRASKIYGNSKRFLMFSLMEYFKDKQIKLSIVHPGVTLTRMTNHYPKLINGIVKLGIKMFFPNVKKASLNIVRGVETNTGYMEWIGPSVFNIYGKPKLKKVKTCSEEEANLIGKIADSIYQRLNEN